MKIHHSRNLCTLRFDVETVSHLWRSLRRVSSSWPLTAALDSFVLRRKTSSVIRRLDHLTPAGCVFFPIHRVHSFFCCSSLSYTWLKEYTPSSRFRTLAPLFLIQIASLIHLVCLFESFSTIFAPSQSMIWFCSAMWSVTADLCTSSTESFLLARADGVPPAVYLFSIFHVLL